MKTPKPNMKAAKGISQTHNVDALALQLNGEKCRASVDTERHGELSQQAQQEMLQLPPFYNRPVHRLPHTQSFMGLIRSQSRTELRFRAGTATPELSADDSDVQGDIHGLGGGSIAPGATTLLPRFRPSIVPTYEYYGFAVYLGSTALFILYITWALLGPERLERWIGDLGWPSRWWATAVPAWLVVLLLYIYVALACYNIQILTPKLNDPRCITDSHAHVCRNPLLFDQGTDAVLDLPPGVVSRALYARRSTQSRDDKED